MTTYSAPADDRIYAGRDVPVRNPSLASITWPPGADCTIPSAEGVNAPIHPKVIDTGVGGWGGYRYWMAFTPYPLSNDDTKENPCVVASNDGDTWVAPAANPIVPAPAGVQQARNFNSDTHLLFHGGVMYLIWRHWTGETDYGPPAVETLYYSASSDGVTWGAHTQIMQIAQDVVSSVLLSPCISFYDGEFWMWAYRRPLPIVCHLYKATSLTGPWTGPTVCDLTINASPSEIWHFDTVRIPNGWAQFIGDRFGTHNDQWVSYSKNGINWEPPKNLSLGVAPQVYRSSFVRNGAGFDCWVGDWGTRKIRRTRLNDDQI